MKVTRLVILAAAVAVLAVPAAALGHPSVYTDDAKTVPSSDPTPATPLEFADLGDNTRYVVSNHGNTYVLRETNGETANGVMDYKALPGAYRSQSSVDTQEMIDNGGTGGQAHHTCKTPALSAVSAIEGWQEESSAGKPEPFFAYVPFQKASAGLDDHPEVWIPHVLTLTGVDLSTVSGDAATATTQLRAMCEALPGVPPASQGEFVPGDTMQTAATALNSGTILAATDPLNAQIADLATQKAAAERAAADAREALAAAPGATTAGQASTRLRLEPVGGKSAARDRSVKVSGPAGMRVIVRLRLTTAAAKAAGWKSLVLDKETATIGQDGTAVVEFTLNGAARAALRKAKSSGVYIAARSGDRWATTRKR